MLCEKCGSPLDQGSSYCLNCGKVQGGTKAEPAPQTIYSAPAAAFTPVAPPLPLEDYGRKEGGYFSSPAGKALAVALALRV